MFTSKEKKSKIISDNTIAVEGLGRFFKNSGKNSPKAGEKLATNVMKKSGQGLEIGPNVRSSAVSTSSKAALSTIPHVLNFIITTKDFVM